MQQEKITSTYIECGNSGGFTDIAKTVGLQSVLAAELVLAGELPITCCHIPTHPAIYPTVPDKLNKMIHKVIEKSEELLENNT